ncbi:carbohydrate ABC transporter permease [Paramicrobacterium chengjingii]|nr:sugar ABC transporter permease [Microbacterium chengjingii]
MYKGAVRWGLSAPLLIFLVLIVVFPLAYGVLTSVQERTLLTPEVTFTGIDNYTDVLTDGEFWRTVWFTVIFTGVTVAVEVALGLGLALLVSQRFYFKKFFVTVILLPIMVASSLMGLLWRLGLNDNMGLIPALFKLIGTEFHPFSSTWVYPTLFTAETLHWTPLVFLLCYAGLQSFSEEQREAARVDGAGYWRIFWSLVLPHLRPVIAIALFLRLIDTAKSFDIIYVLTGGGPGNSTNTVSLYIFRKAFVDGDFGVASAASVVMLVLLLVLVPVVVRQTGVKKEVS